LNLIKILVEKRRYDKVISMTTATDLAGQISALEAAKNNVAGYLFKHAAPMTRELLAPMKPVFLQRCGQTALPITSFHMRQGCSFAASSEETDTPT